jgi:putative transposase
VQCGDDETHLGQGTLVSERGFECDRELNAAMNVLQRGFSELGLGWPESTSVETALPADTTCVSAKRVVKIGSLGA